MTAPRCAAVLTSVQREEGGYASKQHQCESDADVELTVIREGFVAVACSSHVGLVARSLIGRRALVKAKEAQA